MSFMNGLSAAGGGLASYAATAGLEAQKADAATALQASGGVIQSNLLTQKAGLEADQARLADALATTRESGGRVQAAGIAATAAATENTNKIAAAKTAATVAEQAAEKENRFKSTEAETARQAALNAPTPEIKSALQFSKLSPEAKQAFREEAATKAGIPAWMITPDNPAPAGSGALSTTPDDGTTTPVPVAGSSTTPDMGTNRNDKALENVPGAAASIVKGMVDGRISPPSSFAMAKPYWQGLISKAAEYDPTFDQTTWAGRVATRKDFAAGKSSVAVTALNTALSHAGTLVGDFDALNNNGGILTPLNAAGNYIESAFGDPRQAKAKETVDALASEARKVFAASGGGNLTELQEWQKNFPLNGSPAQQKAALTGFVELLDGRLQGLADQYNRGMGRTDDPMSLLQPKARAVYEKLTGREPANSTGLQMGTPPNTTSEPRASSATPATPAAAPVDPAARDVGKTYPLPNGKMGIWRGTGWELAP